MKNRRNFIKLLGLALPSISPLPVYGSKHPANLDTVVIIGAGAAGMAAGHLLAQNGINFKILEAAPTYGGRMKHDTELTDFPIPLGAEWLHVKESELSAIVNDDSVHIDTTTQRYKTSDTYGEYDDGSLTISEIGIMGLWATHDRKFINSSWLSFFEQYILPSVQSKIAFNTQVKSINYWDTTIQLTDQKGKVYEAAKVIITVPAKILQNNTISFTPALPDKKLSTLEEADIWDGFKCFLEFGEKFYPTFLELANSDSDTGQHLYYDAAYGQNTSSNVLGLFAVGTEAEPYQTLSGDTQRDYILDELDEIFAGKASQHYIQHIAQDWGAEPYIQSAYLSNHAATKTSRILAASVDQKLYFAGEAYTKEDDWAAVHNAARSAKDAVEEILGHRV